MNTPSHVLINCAALGGAPPRRVWPVVAGAVLPDAPIFLFYARERRAHVPEAVVWSRDYFGSAVQPMLDALHSFPLILVALGVASVLGDERLKSFLSSLLLHALADFPLHHDDAHRQFFPLSDFRFRSPVSYWDPRHHGAWGAGLELAVTGAAVAVLLRRHRAWPARSAWVAVWALDLVPFLYWR